MRAAPKSLVLQNACVASVYPECHPLWIGLFVFRFVALSQVTALPVSYHVNPAVHDQYDGQREVERAHRREDSVSGLLGDLADGLVLGLRLLPAEQRSDGYDDGEDPQQHHRQQRPALCHYGGVAQRVADSNVAVNGDHAEAHDGSSAAEHVHGGPNVAKDPSEHPPVHNLQNGRKGQYSGAEQQIGHCEINYKIMGDRPQVSVADHGEDYQDVSHYPKRYEDTQNRAQKHSLGHIELRHWNLAAVWAVVR